eukprot:CAMPEP_0204545594 /NCGR_PEP_ID=MMETSP0661-20131031/21387_1 /ASSEMBLY_ACC=CAM_ASM_000606 /TAXON_ID=109239 /ORGANISM="Alexandrium margalefi, Strain AMGDE01CS-322" /LENGTH=180 /DNA_ID=CAMNT_0051552391 /DNA_START=139 /DNA_END=677 /DNA_ORIENTATION=+
MSAPQPRHDVTGRFLGCQAGGRRHQQVRAEAPGRLRDGSHGLHTSSAQATVSLARESKPNAVVHSAHRLPPNQGSFSSSSTSVPSRPARNHPPCPCTGAARGPASCDRPRKVAMLLRWRASSGKMDTLPEFFKQLHMVSCSPPCDKPQRSQRKMQWPSVSMLFRLTWSACCASRAQRKAT